MYSGTDAGSGTSAVADAGARVVLYVRAGCHLCEEARQVLTEVLDAVDGPADAPAGPADPADTVAPRWTEIDIEAGPDAARLVDTYGELVPVVTIDGVRQGYWRLDAGRLRRALAGGGA